MFTTPSLRPSRGDGPSRSNTPSNTELHELSDVQCYTCRRRHVKCDRILPTCAKCRKKGVPCLGYQRPLRWADGVAVRGKLKGKSQPVVDTNVINLVRNSVQQHVNTVLKEAAHFGLHATDNCCNDVVADGSQLSELMAYHNSIICTERITIEETKVIERHMAPLSHEVAQRLPKTIVNCILGIAAVHMASRHVGNRALERLALETKVNVFQNHNRLIQISQNKADLQPDVVICSGILIFAMDLFEHGMSRWRVHTLGSMHVISSLGGIENLAFHYPHLHVPFFHVAHFETMWGILSYIPITKPKQITRAALELLCHSDLAKKNIFNPCPTPLTLAAWDVGSCAQAIFGSSQPIGFADMHTREQILLEVLEFSPKDATKAMQDVYCGNPTFAEANTECWDTINTAWRAAITVIVLRFLYFGRPDLNPQLRSHVSPSTFTAQSEKIFMSHDYYQQDTFPVFDELMTDSTNPDHIDSNFYLNESLSTSSSPLSSPLPHIEPPIPQLWYTRYKIHDEAFATLSTTLATLHGNTDPVYVRYILLPIIILGLVSRPDSKERTLCLSYLAKLKAFMSRASDSPIGGEALDFVIPWERLDAFSENVERERRDSVMKWSAPEWNWGDMLRHIDLDLSWPVTSGTSHLEHGSEFWAFKLMSSVVNDECFNNWLQDPVSSYASSSSA